MKLDESTIALKAGQAVRRQSWTKQDGYLILLKGMKHVWKIIIDPAPNAGNHIYSFDDLCAEDWVVYSGHEFDAKVEELDAA